MESAIANPQSAMGVVLGGEAGSRRLAVHPAGLDPGPARRVGGARLGVVMGTGGDAVTVGRVAARVLPRPGAGGAARRPVRDRPRGREDRGRRRGGCAHVPEDPGHTGVDLHECVRRPREPLPRDRNGRAGAPPRREVPPRGVRQGELGQRAVVRGHSDASRTAAGAPDRGPHRPPHRDRRSAGRARAAGRAHGDDPLRLAGRCVPSRRRRRRRAGGRRRPGARRRDRARGARRVRPFPRPSIRRVVVVVPSLFTLFNLFFGIWAMVLASRAEFYRAGWYIFFAGILDALDGRVARLSKTGSRFGAELDSLVDAVSFGVAPAFLVYQLEFASAGQAEWIFCYFYVMAVTIRLARFNLTQAGRSKRYFIGLPSPAAGTTLATFYPFTTTDLFQQLFRVMPRHHLMQLLMILLTILMVSNVRYATLPRAGFRSWRGLLGLATVLFILIFGVLEHDAFFFPLGIVYMAYGVLRATVLGFFLEAGEDEEAEIAGPIVITDGDQVDEAYGPRPRGVAPRGSER